MSEAPDLGFNAEYCQRFVGGECTLCCNIPGKGIVEWVGETIEAGPMLGFRIAVVTAERERVRFDLSIPYGLIVYMGKKIGLALA